MTDHLMSLVLRTLSPGRIRPRRYSPFEPDALAAPGPQAMPDDDAGPFTGAAPAPDPPLVRQDLPHQETLPSPLTRSVRQASPVTGLPESSTNTRASAAPARATPATALQPPDPPRHAPEPSPPVVLAEPLRRRPPAPGERIETVRLHEHREVHREHVERRETLQKILEQKVTRLVVLEPQIHRHAGPQSDTYPEPPRVRAEAPPAAGTVEVSIGRIEILPQAGPVRVQREEGPRPQAAQSLETYLRRRSASNGREGVP